MPITYEIDRARRIVFARAAGILTPHDLFAYQQEVWSAPDLRDHDECVDMSAVTAIEDATDRNMKALAEIAVRTDDPALKNKLAIIAHQDLHFGLARMYETYRNIQPKHSRQVAVFRTRDEALRWLAGEGTAD